MGIVSAKGRANLRIVDYEDFIQTDAAINPGNSGGALVSMRGELIGINTAILSRSGGYQGIGFAIPTNMAVPILKSLIKTGKVVRGYLGVMIQDVDDDLAGALKLPHKRGVLISDVVPAGPAAKAGIKRSDFIVAIEGKSVDSASKLRNLIAGYGAKRTVKLDLYRNGKRKTVKAKLGQLDAKGAAVTGGQPAGLDLAPLSAANRRRFSIPREVPHGVVIQRLARDSKAAEVGLQPGDVILEANRVKIDNVRRFSQVYAKAKRRVLLLVYREGSTFYLLLPK
jgi:serine protease Do